VCRYVLSEFADQVPDRSPAQLAEELTPRLALAPVATQGLLLTALMKLRMHAPHDKGLQRHVEEIFKEYSSDVNTDIQQRAVEYLAYSKMGDNEVVRSEVFAPMPDWPDKVMLVTQVRFLHSQNEYNEQQS
jgi:AP-2 complex subunit alpha